MEEERGKERKRVSSGLKRALSGHFMTFWTTLLPHLHHSRIEEFGRCRRNNDNNNNNNV